MKHIYVDYAATTPTDKRIVKKIQPYFSDIFGNPSSVHSIGVEAKKALDESRSTVAKFFNCSPSEVFFTGSGTESENLAIKGRAFTNKKFGSHIVISSIEHAAVESSASFLEKQGFTVSRIPADNTCTVDIKALEAAIRDDTTIVSVMYVNNEVGTIQPIQDISTLIKKINSQRQSTGKNPIYFHVDGEAASVYMDFDVNKLGVDSITINGSKLYGVKGVSALYLKGGKGVATQICGGGQESYIRGGTENLPAIVALAEATSITLADRASNNSKISLLKEKLIDSLKKEIPSVRINTPVNSISNIVHVTFLNQQKIDIINELDKRGICASNGAATKVPPVGLLRLAS